MQEEKNLTRKELTDDEAGQAAGGNGEFTIETYLNKVTHYCNAAPDNATFQSYYLQLTLNCPNYIFGGGDINTATTLCTVCGHYSYNSSSKLF